MPKGQFVRKTKAEKIAELKKQLEALENEATLDAKSPDVAKLIEAVKKVATDNNWKVRDVLKVVADAAAPRQKRPTKAVKNTVENTA